MKNLNTVLTNFFIKTFLSSIMGSICYTNKGVHYVTVSDFVIFNSQAFEFKY